MRGMVPPDPESDVSRIRWAIVYLPRRSRKRFPAGCVRIVDDPASARAGADPGRNYYAARVLGPSKSSEGQLLFYLVEWLDIPA